MRLGLFLNFEHGTETSAKVFKAQTELAVEAENFGLDELWVSEHHFNPFSQSASTLPLMAHLAALTRRIRIGSAALLMPLHHPVRVAEDIATIDILAGGRIDLGLARGGPFPVQFRHFHIDPQEARTQADEATEFLLRLLSEEDVTFTGRWYRSEGLTTLPRPLQRPFPVWVASASDQTVSAAGRRGFGLMAGHAWSPNMMDELLRAHRAASGPTQADARLTVLRTCCVADSDAAALAIAKPAIERFHEKMRLQFDPARAIPPFSMDKALSQAVIGSPETCRRRLAELASAVPVASLVMKPACLDPAATVEIVGRFRREIVEP
jgi:luciferase family oxidoreductase group 1